MQKRAPFFFLILSLAFSYSLFADPSCCFFRPPENWQCANPKALAEHVQIGFIGKGKKNFKPSINLATEEVDVSLKEYLQAAKEAQKTDRNTILDLGTIETKAGLGQLLEISARTTYGNIRMLQMILIRATTAYVMTGAVLEEEFMNNSKYFLEAFRSIEISPDLLSPIKIEAKRQKLQKQIETLSLESDTKKLKKQWKELQKIVLKDYTELGVYWQILLIKNVLKKLPPNLQAILRD